MASLAQNAQAPPAKDTKTPLSESDLRTLEQLRQSLSQLTSTLNTLSTSLQNYDPLPPPASLQSQTKILTTNLAFYQQQLSAASPMLSRLSVFPTPALQSTQAEKVMLVQNLLRKKLGEGAEAWVEGALKRGSGGEGGNGDGDGGRERDRKELKELWEWAGPEANRFARGFNWGVGGLDGVDEDEEEEEDDDDDEPDEEMEEEEGMGDGKEVVVIEDDVVGIVEAGEVKKKPLTVEEVIRFMSTGRRPGG